MIDDLQELRKALVKVSDQPEFHKLPLDFCDLIEDTLMNTEMWLTKKRLELNKSNAVKNGD